MRQAKITKIIGLILLFMIVCAVSFFLGDKYAVEAMTVTRATPDQIASAMKTDHFYSDYRESTLLVKGTVASVSKDNNRLVVQFKTDSSFKALCDFGNASPGIHRGDTIRVLSEGGSALRQPSAVLLQNCTIP